jgi:hypothetical protein
MVLRFLNASARSDKGVDTFSSAFYKLHGWELAARALSCA